MTGRRPLLALVVLAVLVAGCAAPVADGPGSDATPASGEASATTGRGASSTAPNATPTRAAAEVPPPDVTVRLNCTALRVNVTPEAWHYRLYLRYRDTATDDQRRIAAGYFTGTVTDDFGWTDFVLVAVEVRVTGFAPVLRTRPTHCPDEKE